jgi:flavin-dependent dehydrogenase
VAIQAGSPATANGWLDLPLFEFRAGCRPGYAWIFPLGNGLANFGVCRLSGPAGTPLRTLAADYARERGILHHTALRGAREAPWSGRGRRWHHPAGLVSCGDAAGVADPLTGEGISAALMSGERAGEAVARYLQDGRAIAHLEAYSEWVGEHFSAAYRPSPFRQIWARLSGK